MFSRPNYIITWNTDMPQNTLQGRLAFQVRRLLKVHGTRMCLRIPCKADWRSRFVLCEGYLEHRYALECPARPIGVPGTCPTECTWNTDVPL